MMTFKAPNGLVLADLSDFEVPRTLCTDKAGLLNANFRFPLPIYLLNTGEWFDIQMKNIL